MSDSELKHIAIVMDGNGRWAKRQHEKRTVGHYHGSENIRTIALEANHKGVKVLTLYAFSTENWKRPLEEVNYLMKLPAVFLDAYLKELMENDIKIIAIGDLSELPKDTQRVLNHAIQRTAANTSMILCFAMNYGGQLEIVRAANLYALEKLADPELPDLTIASFEKYLYTSELPPVDLMIRTGGEIRLSNYLLWQNAYSEFIFIDKAWPDFSKEDLDQCIQEFYSRQRRFGDVK